MIKTSIEARILAIGVFILVGFSLLSLASSLSTSTTKFSTSMGLRILFNYYGLCNGKRF